MKFEATCHYLSGYRKKSEQRGEEDRCYGVVQFEDDDRRQVIIPSDLFDDFEKFFEYKCLFNFRSGVKDGKQWDMLLVEKIL